MKIKRRTFVKTGACAALSVPFINYSCTTPSSEKIISSRRLYAQFQDPPNSARVFVRWWWNGDRLSEKEILRELDVMRQAGIGGVEINPIKFPGEADPVGVESIEWLSDAWIDMLRVALEGAKKRGIICDMIVGSGWPFGAEFLEGTERTQMVAVETKDLEGGKPYQFSRQALLDEVEPHFHSSYERKQKELLMVRLVPAEMNTFDPGLDLSDQFNGDMMAIDVPEGRHVLYWLVKITGFQAVINGAPGAMGPVLNHYNKPAVEKYLNRMSERLRTSLGSLGKHFRAMFCDSLELEGANWCEDMFEQFETRRGYDLKPYFPFVLFKIGHMGNPVPENYGATFSEGVVETIQKVRYDFELTRIELFRERFIETFAAWCTENGVQARSQAYGRGYHPLESSMLIDIPECETWLGSSIGGEIDDRSFGLRHYRRGRAYTMINKFVSSGARLAGKKVISCEEITNTSMVFNATLERIKIAGDQSNLSGVTHSVLHGFYYSPPESPFPGWIRYGTYFNEQNTWWPFFRQWSDYKARLSVVFQNSELVSDIAVMHPLADMWAQFGAQRDPFPTLLFPPYQHQVWEAIHQHGHGCDYISEAIVEKAQIVGEKLVYGKRQYKVLMLLEVESISVQAARKLEEFVAGGGKLVLVGKTPSKSMESPKNEHDQESAAALFNGLLKRAADRVALVPAPESNLSEWYRSVQDQFEISPYLKFEKPTTAVSQVYYRSDGLDIFFISNSSMEMSVDQIIEFMVSEDRTAWHWDPETGDRSIYPEGANTRTLRVALGPAASRLIVFEKDSSGEAAPLEVQITYDAVEVQGPWQITLHHINGQKHALPMQKLRDLSEDPDTRSFAGVIHYQKVIEYEGNSGQVIIDLGRVHGVSELAVNGINSGHRWYGHHRYDISEQLKEGDNALQISVTTTLGNYLKSSEENPVGQRWTRRQPYFPMGLIGPVRIGGL
jgi:hypothetical protein